ncbi:unnamed protein product [Peniophora sp. CBMAI 1063]|nr:unnamed protein product [Peniophora sp. CBMAI 1063]
MAYFKSAATKVSHSSTFAIGGNKDLRPLQDLITAEKNVLTSLVKLSTDLTKATDALQHWGQGEGDDLGDVLNGCHKLLTRFASSVSRYASHEQGIRDHMKAVRAREENLDRLKHQRRQVASKADAADKKLNKMSPENKNLQAQTDLLLGLRNQTRDLDAEILAEEASLGDFKREATRNWMTLKFGGLQELCEKGLITADFGKLIITELPIETTQPGTTRGYYLGHSQTEAYANDAQVAMSEVVFHGEPPLGGPRQRARPPPDASYAAHPDSVPGGPPPEELGMLRPSQDGVHSQTFSGPPAQPAPQRGFGATQFSTLPTRLESFHREDSFAAEVEQGLAERRQSMDGKSSDPNKRASEQYYPPPAGPPPGAAPPLHPSMPEESAYGGYDPGYGPEDYQSVAANPNRNSQDPQPQSPMYEQHQQQSEQQYEQQYAPPPGPPDAGTPRMGRVPVPRMESPQPTEHSADDRTDESALNAAAAREVAREMDHLTFNPPYQPPRLPTPQPPADANASSGSSPPTESQPRRSYSPIPVTTEPPATAMPAALPPAYQLPRSQSPPSQGPPYSPIPVPESPPATSAPSAPLPSAYLPRTDSNGTSTPLGLGRPAPSMGGPRTISAAAFRRPARTTSDATATPTSPTMHAMTPPVPVPIAGMADTSPLALRKRDHGSSPSNGSVSSPHQSGFSTAGSTPSLRQFPPPPQGQGHGQAVHDGGEEENFDYISAYLGGGEGEGHKQDGDFR